MTSIDNDIFVKVRFLYPSLSKSEKAVADILLDEGENVTNYTIAEYAEKAGCSDASILRFCRRLGVEGFADLKQQLADVTSYTYDHGAYRISKEDGLRTIFQKIIWYYERTLKDTLTLYNDDYDNALEAMRKAKAIQMCIRDSIKDKQGEIKERIKEENRKADRLGHFLLYGTGETMQNYKPVVKPLPGCVAASMRRVIPDHGALFDLMPNVMGPEMMRLGCECAVPAYCFNICRDGEYRETDIDMEMCEAVVEAKEDSDIVTFKTIPGVPEAVCVRHYGGYDTFAPAHAFAAEWAAQNGYELCGEPRESYIDGIWNRETVAEWMTEIQFPVKKAGR